MPSLPPPFSRPVDSLISLQLSFSRFLFSFFAFTGFCHSHAISHSHTATLLFKPLSLFHYRY